ncbi:MAG: hypothetical protein OXI87_20440 [Albidovulum sp.]|nr:hypothetical protein [Albidovulum sp.]
MTQLPGTNHFSAFDSATRTKRANLVVYIAGIIASIAWIAFSAMVLLLDRGDSEPLVSIQPYLEIVAFLAPLVLIWLAAQAIRSSISSEHSIRYLRAEQEELRRRLGASDTRWRELEDSLLAEVSSKNSTDAGYAPELKKEYRVPQPEPQPQLFRQANQGMEYHGKVSARVLIRALNLPEDENDTDGFEALNRAMEIEGVRILLDNSQRVLVTLADSNIFTDNLNPDLARPEIWRMHATGEKKQVISTLGGIRDVNLLEVVAERLEKDEDFYELAQSFVARFQSMLQQLIGSTTDTDIIALANTRTARAFILLGNALSGEF